MRLRWVAIALLAALFVEQNADSQTVAITETDAQAWIRHTLPLPHEISITSAVAVPVGQIDLTIPEGSGELVEQARRVLRGLLRSDPGAQPGGKSFEIVLGCVDSQGALRGARVDGAERLAALPNRDQACIIRPAGDRRLVVAALGERGVYYGALTLAQLLAARITKDAVLIPLAAITDWPDFDERGVWNVGYSTPGFIPWLASLKLNFTHIAHGIVFRPGGVAECPPLPLDLMALARAHAFNLMPHSPHFDYWFRHNLDKLYPDLIGKGDTARNPAHKHYPGNDAIQQARCLCASNPLMTQLLTGWTTSAARQGATEVSIWLSEFTPEQCACETCMKDGPRQFQLETQAAVRAITEARKVSPSLRGRVFFTFITRNPVYDKAAAECLAMLPLYVRAEKVYGPGPVFDAYAAKGAWLANYSGAEMRPGRPGAYLRYGLASEMLNHPQRGIRGFREKGYSALYCAASFAARENVKGDWERGFGDYQYSALAEWTWNANGRSVREFAEAWATTRGIAAPAKFAEWIEAIEPAAAYVDQDAQNRSAAWLAAAADPAGKAAADWLARLPNRDAVDAMIAACDRALPLAVESGDAAASLETRFIRAWLAAQTRLAERVALVSQAPPAQPGAQDKISALTRDFDSSILELQETLDNLTLIPAVNPQAGPEMLRSRFKAWAGSLRPSRQQGH